MCDAYFRHKPQQVSIACSTSIKRDGRELSMQMYFTITNLTFKLKSIFHFSGPLTLILGFASDFV